VAKPSEHPTGLEGQLELMRRMATGNFRDLAIAMSRHPAMIVWLDGRTNLKGKPQENFARELMELFTMGVGNYTEEDVYAGARVFTGWNLTGRQAATATPYYNFFYNANQHDTTAKTFTFPIYPTGERTIPSRSAAAGIQDGIDLIDACVRHPATGARLARKLYGYFVNEVDPPDETLIANMAADFRNSGFEIKPMLIRLFVSPQFTDPSNYFKRYSWPVEFVVRAIKEMGWSGFSVNDALNPLTAMGQQLFEPPDVAGWDLGERWFTSGAMLARMNFAATLAANQRLNLVTSIKLANARRTADNLMFHMTGALRTAPLDPSVAAEWANYLRATGAWTGSDAQLQAKAMGLAHLIAGSPEYQLV